MTATHSRNLLERILNLFTEVRSGEGTRAILLSFNIFLILAAYYIMKPVREALIIAGSGAEVKSYAAAIQAVLVVILVPLYARFADRLRRRRLINGVTVFFVACLILFYLLAQVDIPYLDVAFFLWLGIFSLMITAQFWAFANDLYTPEEGKRLFVIIALGAPPGAVMGGVITNLLIDWLGVYQLLLVAGGLLLLSLLLTNIVETGAAAIQEPERAEQWVKVELPAKTSGAFRLVFQTRYLILLAFLTMFLNWVNTTGEYILGRTVQQTAREQVASDRLQNLAQRYASERSGVPAGAGSAEMEGYKEDYLKQYREKYIGDFYAKFYTGVNLAGLLIQLFVVSRILKFFGVRAALIVLPLIALGGYLVMALYPVLGIIRWVKTAENSTDYSLQNTVRQVLFLPTTREQKYKAKQAIDTFFWRAGDVLSALLVFAGTTWFAFETKQFALSCVLLVTAWLALAVLLGREHTKLTRSLDQGSPISGLRDSSLPDSGQKS
jgi:AAA family ATP:ADP antiporter